MTKHETPISDALRKSQEAIYPRKESEKFSGQWSENAVRTHRAITWLRCWEKCPETNPDEHFVFLWIAFNAAYAQHDDAVLAGKKEFVKEMKKIKEFLSAIADRDDNLRLVDIVDKFKDDIFEIIKKEFLSGDYWKARTQKAWKAARSKKDGFDRQVEQVETALRPSYRSKKKIKDVLLPTFERLYILRNQVLHGGATYGGRYNRRSLEPGSAILGACMPAILEIMLDALKKQPNMRVWGKVEYPPHLKTPDPINPNPPPPREY